MSQKDAHKRWMGRLAPVKPQAPATTSGATTGAFPAVPAQGLGLTSERLRARMVERLRENGVRDARVLAAMGEIPRHRFVDEGLASRAYEDSALPIGFEQTISQPLVVALMTEAVLAGGAPTRVLEVGTGCGYQAAILSRCCAEVYSIERIGALHARARHNLRPLRLPNVRLVLGDGMQGLAQVQPFDAMLVAAAASEVPRALLEQLTIGGRVVAPLGGRDEQLLCVISRISADEFRREVLERVRFVPLLPGVE